MAVIVIAVWYKVVMQEHNKHQLDSQQKNMLENNTFNYQLSATQGQGAQIINGTNAQFGATSVQFATGGVNGNSPPPTYAMQSYSMQPQQNDQGQFGSYRSPYLHSHAKPPYSYISLIAMAIQVRTVFYIICILIILSRLGLSAYHVHTE